MFQMNQQGYNLNPSSSNHVLFLTLSEYEIVGSLSECTMNR